MNGFSDTPEPRSNGNGRALTTGEFAAAARDNDGIRITATTLIAIIGLVLGAVGGPLSFYVGQKVQEDRQDRLASEIQELRSLVATQESRIRQNELRLQREEDSKGRIVDSLAELKADVKEIKDTMTRRVGSGPR